MGLSELFSAGRVPKALIGRTLVLGEAADLMQAGGLLAALESRFGPIALGIVGEAAYGGPHAHVELPATHGADRKRIKRLRPERLIVIGRAGDRVALVRDVEAPKCWLNALSPQAAQAGCERITVAGARQQALIPDSILTGDPLLELDAMPALDSDPTICERFAPYRERGHSVVCAAGTGEHEEPIAYAMLFELLRDRTTILILAPRDPQRYEPVYRDAIKYNLPTIRHSRLMTSYVPHKNRVYFVEAEHAATPLLACADVVVAGGSLHARAGVEPDLLTALRLGRPVIVGPVRPDRLTRSAVESGVVRDCPDAESLAGAARELLDDPEGTQTLTAEASSWLQLQSGARQRVLDLLG
jgi:3-deoxy-D-manno-octulosonic-acid transferase